MKHTWPELFKKYVVYSEDKPLKRVSLSGVYNRIKQDLDYMLILRGPHGEIYRYDLAGEYWGVYLKPSKGGHWRRGLMNTFNSMKGLEPKQIGSCEGAWKFEASLLDEVATLIKAKKRRKKGAKDVSNQV